MSLSLVLNLCNLAIFIGIIWGTIVHHRVVLHVKIMKICFALDLALLVVVEVLRDAIQKAIGITESGDIDKTLLYIHIAFAVLTLVFWIMQVITGSKVLKGDRSRLPSHARNAKIFLLLRLATLVTAFML